MRSTTIGMLFLICAAVPLLDRVQSSAANARDAVRALRAKLWAKPNARIQLANTLIEFTDSKTKSGGYLLLAKALAKEGKRGEAQAAYAQGIRLAYPGIASEELDKIVLVAQAPQPPPATKPQPSAAPSPTPTPTTPEPELPPTSPILTKAILGETKLAPSQPSPASAPAQSIGQSIDQAPPDIGNLFRASNQSQGVEVQQRSPVVGDPRIRGTHFGEIITQSDGGYWFPARVDLDTVISKLNVENIDNILIIRGPFSARYGPGFAFMDIVATPTPRSQNGYFQGGGTTSGYYRTNGSGWNGQQSLWGGGDNWGFRLNYNVMAANDYTMGNGQKLPSSYNNQFLNFAFGIDLSANTSLEVKYLHAQQSDVAIPGLLTDIRTLNSDAVTGRFLAVDGVWFDRAAVDVWLNNTTFAGDSSRQDTRDQIPLLNNAFPGVTTALPGALPIRLDINTQGTGLSYGARQTTTWGEAAGFNIAAGADVRVFTNQYNEFDAFNLSVFPGSTLPVNLGVPNSRWVNPGLFADSSIPLGERWNFKVGGRLDFSDSRILNFGPNAAVVTPASNLFPSSYTQVVGPLSTVTGDKFFFLPSGFMTGQYKIDEAWTASASYGYAQRPPTLTELFAGGPFLGLIQNGLNSIFGNPNLRQEQLHQIDFGLNGKYEGLRVGGNAFYGFMPNYITYDPINVAATSSTGVLTLAPNVSRDTAVSVLVPGGALVQSGTGLSNQINALRFANTGLATMYGFEAYGEYDVLPWLTPFAILNFVEGWDQTRNVGLPGIPPLDSRAGLRFHEPGKNARWGVEYFARMVAAQDVFASNLGEQRTAGFVIHYLRGYWQVRSNILVLGGVENLGDRFYREHLDLRTGFGVFQPGVNFYFGTKISY